MLEMRAIRAIGQLMMTGSASGWALAFSGPLSGVPECRSRWRRERYPDRLAHGGLTLLSFAVVPAVESLKVFGQEGDLGGL